ncbi:MAG: hypothetical protein GC192_21180 [Bacteroidetes bacterium]|nr:hypothetical protein [Bacteroidota bacterium]
MATQKSDLKLDGFVASVRPDPKSNEQATLLQGYLGKSSEAEHVRVYFDEELNNFVDVPKADILHCVSNDRSENPLGGSRIWVKKSTVVIFGDPASANRAKSSFLEGDLISAYDNMVLGGQKVPEIYLTKICTILRTAATVCCPSKLIACQASIKSPCQDVSIVQPSCVKTCLQFTCLQTCRFVSCFKSCWAPTCFKSCLPNACTICFTGSIHTTINPTVEISADIAAQQQQMFQGTFDPFQTGNYGY